MARRRKQKRQGRLRGWYEDWAPSYNDSGCRLHVGRCDGEVTRWQRAGGRMVLPLCESHVNRLGMTEAGFEEVS